MQAAATQVFPFVRGPLTATEREQHRLDRLRELRATIEALRSEQASNDPLLAWVMAQGKSDPSRHS